MKTVWATAALAALAVLVLAAPQPAGADGSCTYCSEIPCERQAVERTVCDWTPSGPVCWVEIEEWLDCSAQDRCWEACLTGENGCYE